MNELSTKRGTNTKDWCFTKACVLALTGGLSAGAFAQSANELIPNLRALPAYDIVMERNFGGVLELRFTSSIWNDGAGPLELIAGEVSKGRQFVRQRVYDDQGTYQEYLAGKFVWHQGHSHFHFEDFALYQLQAVQGNSKRDSVKTSFCVMDSNLVDGSLPGSPGRAIYENCGNFFQGVSVGWADEYGSHLPGQSFDLTRLKDGQYRLTIEADPKNRLLELNDTDNSSCVLLDINISEETYQILNPDNCDDGSNDPPPPGGNVQINSILPSSASVGDSVSVLIDGSGFANGMAVEFVNGKGSKPVASDVQVLSASQISAIVTVKKRGGNSSDNVWDLMVGNATLIDAFTVLP